MKIIYKIKEMQKISANLRMKDKKIAYVPTMGYLHEGHLSLIQKARQLGDIIVLSIFVNPTQFAPNEDYNSYPRDPDRDFKLAEENGADYIFYPDVNEMYPSGYNTKVIVEGITEKFEGAMRPSHFDGVSTIVTKLFNAVKPHYAVFGQKDYQQTLVIRQMVSGLNMDIDIVVAPTVREEDGLAKSSRNKYLSPEDRKKADILFRTLKTASKVIAEGEKKRKIINAVMIQTLRKETTIKIDYCMAADADNLDEPEEFIPGQRIVLLLAVYLGKTRLIDNAVVTLPSNISSRPKYFIDGMENN